MRGKVLIESVEHADDKINLEMEGSHLVLTDKKSSLRLPTMSSEAYLFELPNTDRSHFCISGNLASMRELMQSVDLAASNSNEEALKAELVGVTFKAYEEELRLYSTDNVSCTRIEAVGVEVTGAGTEILAKSSCQIISKTFRDLEPLGMASCAFYFLEGSVLVDYQDENEQSMAWVVCKTVPTKPADYEKIIEANSSETNYGDLPEGFDNALARASAMFSDDYARCVTIDADEGPAFMQCVGDYGEFKVELDFDQIRSEPVKLNPDLVRRMLPHCAVLTFGKNALVMAGETDYRNTLYLVAYKKE